MKRSVPRAPWQRGPVGAAITCALVAGAILALDKYIALGVATGVLYVVVVLLALQTRRRGFVLLVAAGCSVLIGVGFFVSAPLGIPWQVLANRSLALAVVWVVAVVGLRRNQAEGRRIRSEESLRAIVDTAPDGVVTFGEDGRLLSINDAGAALFGYRSEEILDEKVSRLVPELRGTAAPTKELEGERQDGTTVPLEVAIGETRLPDGRCWYTAIVRDISERKRSERELLARQRELEATNRDLDGFSYSVSHDLRAPLRAIDGFAKVLDEEHAAKLDQDGRRVLGIIRKNAGKMARLIDDLLAFSRLGRRRVRSSPVDMTELATDVLEELRALENGRTIEPSIARLPQAVGDPALLRQVWVNLIGNALKYTRGRDLAVIEVAGEHSGDENSYVVKDNGVGFDMQYADKLFGVFQRLHSPKDFEGTGVGLALVQRIVVRHGGRVWADARPDDGASFHFTLPTAAARGEGVRDEQV